MDKKVKKRSSKFGVLARSTHRFGEIYSHWFFEDYTARETAQYRQNKIPRICFNIIFFENSEKRQGFPAHRIDTIRYFIIAFRPDSAGRGNDTDFIHSKYFEFIQGFSGEVYRGFVPGGRFGINMVHIERRRCDRFGGPTMKTGKPYGGSPMAHTKQACWASLSKPLSGPMGRYRFCRKRPKALILRRPLSGSPGYQHGEDEFDRPNSDKMRQEIEGGMGQTKEGKRLSRGYVFQWIEQGPVGTASTCKQTIEKLTASVSIQSIGAVKTLGARRLGEAIQSSLHEDGIIANHYALLGILSNRLTFRLWVKYKL